MTRSREGLGGAVAWVPGTGMEREGTPGTLGCREQGCDRSTGREEAAAKESAHGGPGPGRRVPKHPRKDPKT